MSRGRILLVVFTYIFSSFCSFSEAQQTSVDPIPRVAAPAKQAAVIAELVDNYESTFVPTGRTLAEIINLPAKIFTKMIWLHNMMEVTEGPVTASMREVYEQPNTERDQANSKYQKDISAALKEFESLVD